MNVSLRLLFLWLFLCGSEQNCLKICFRVQFGILYLLLIMFNCIFLFCFFVVRVILLFWGVKLIVLLSRLFSVWVSSLLLLLISILFFCQCRVIVFVVRVMLCFFVSCWYSVFIDIGCCFIFSWFFSFVCWSSCFISSCIWVFCVRILLVNCVVILGGGFLCRIFVVLWMVVSGFFSLWVRLQIQFLMVFLFLSFICMFFRVWVSLCNLLLLIFGSGSGCLVVIEFVQCISLLIEKLIYQMMLLLINSVMFSRVLLVQRICCLLCLMIGVIVRLGLLMFSMLIICFLFIIGVVIYIIELVLLCGLLCVLCVLYWLCRVSQILFQCEQFCFVVCLLELNIILFWVLVRQMWYLLCIFLILLILVLSGCWLSW